MNYRQLNYCLSHYLTQSYHPVISGVRISFSALHNPEPLSPNSEPHPSELSAFQTILPSTLSLALGQVGYKPDNR